MKNKKNAISWIWGPLLKGISIGVLLLLVFCAGFLMRGVLETTPLGIVSADPPVDYVLLQEVHRLLDEHYLRGLPEESVLEYAAIRGMTGSLEDPYTFFIDPPVAQSESDVLAGQYGGVGVQVQHAANGDYVLYPFPDSPARKAGIEDGDVLIAIDDWQVASDARMDVIDQALRGEVDGENGVTIVVRKLSGSEEVSYSVPFEVIAIPSVITRQLVEDPRIGYVQIMRFTSRTPDELQQAFDALDQTNIEVWVLDLRNNAGGLLQEAIETADLLLEEGIIVIERTKDSSKDYLATSGDLIGDLPIIVLVNHGTASAAELVAGALRDNGRATIIGQNTYGKGSVQLIFPLPDGSSIHITSAEWFTPSETPLEQEGLTPDIPMIPAEDGRDVELDEAIRQLQQSLQQ